MKSILLSLLLLTSLFGAHAAAQEPCVSDLSPAVSMLMAAQAQASSGDTDAALAGVREARAALTTMRDACASAGITAVLLLDGEFVSPDSSFLFNYPEGWAFGTATMPAENLLVQPLGNSARAAEQALQASPLLSAGEQAAFVAVGDASGFGMQASDAPVVLLNAIVASLPEDFSAEPIVESVVDGIPTASLRYTGPSFDGLIIVRVLSAELGLVAEVAGFAPSGELEPLVPVIEAMARSVR